MIISHTKSGRLRALQSMRLILLLGLLMASCAPSPTQAPANGSTNPASSATAPTASASDPQPATTVEPVTPPKPKPSPPPEAPRFLRTSLAGISIEAVTFDARTHRLVVADQPQGPGSLWPNSQAAGQSSGGIAAINGGFFTPEGAPLGRVVANGTSVGGVNRASSLGSGFFVSTASGMKLVRREQFSGGSEALQTGPFLVENGKPVGGLSTKSSGARSFIACDGGSRWVIARTGACSLDQLARALSGRQLGSTPLTQVLNLDGGRSSELWASGKIPGGPRFTRPLWNKSVRNFLIIQSR